MGSYKESEKIGDLKMDKNNIVFKCNLCNGGDRDKNGELKNKKEFGFNGVCTKDLIDYNIKKAKRSWCSHKDSLCRNYYDGIISYEELLKKSKNTIICSESQMLDKWIAFAGWDNNSRIKPRKILNTGINNLAVLTLIQPNLSEKERRIFAVFMIDDYYEGDGKSEDGYVACKSEYKLSFNRAEANDMKLWNFYENISTESCRWGSGLFRYIDNIKAAQILKQAYKVKKGTADEQNAKSFLEHYCKIKGIKIDDIPEPNGGKIKSMSDYNMV